MQQDGARDEAGRDEVGDPAVDQRARVEHVQVAPRHARGPRLDPDQSEDVLVLRLAEPVPERPEREVEEHDRRPRGGRRQEQERDHHQPRDEETHEQPHHSAGEDRRRLLPQLGFEAVDRPQGETSEDATDHVADPGTGEDEQEGAAGAGGAGGLTDPGPDRGAERDEDHPDAAGDAATEDLAATPLFVVRHDAHPRLGKLRCRTIRPLQRSSARAAPALSRSTEAVPPGGRRTRSESSIRPRRPASRRAPRRAPHRS